MFRKFLVGFLTLISLTGCGGPPDELVTINCGCTGEADFPDNTYVDLTFEASTFSDGSVLSTCAIFGARTSYSNTFLFKPTVPGARNASCILGYDSDNTASGGLWEFDLNPETCTGARAVYTDTNSPNSGSYNLTCVKR